MCDCAHGRVCGCDLCREACLPQSPRADRDTHQEAAEVPWAGTSFPSTPSAEGPQAPPPRPGAWGWTVPGRGHVGAPGGHTSPSSPSSAPTCTPSPPSLGPPQLGTETMAEGTRGGPLGLYFSSVWTQGSLGRRWAQLKPQGLGNTPQGAPDPSPAGRGCGSGLRLASGLSCHGDVSLILKEASAVPGRIT